MKRALEACLAALTGAGLMAALPAPADAQRAPETVCVSDWRHANPGDQAVQEGDRREQQIDLDQDGQAESREVVLVNCETTERRPVAMCLDAWQHANPGDEIAGAGMRREREIDLDQDGEDESQPVILVDCPEAQTGEDEDTGFEGVDVGVGFGVDAGGSEEQTGQDQQQDADFGGFEFDEPDTEFTINFSPEPCPEPPCEPQDGEQQKVPGAEPCPEPPCEPQEEHGQQDVPGAEPCPEPPCEPQEEPGQQDIPGAEPCPELPCEPREGRQQDRQQDDQEENRQDGDEQAEAGDDEFEGFFVSDEMEATTRSEPAPGPQWIEFEPGGYSASDNGCDWSGDVEVTLEPVEVSEEDDFETIPVEMVELDLQGSANLELEAVGPSTARGHWPGHRETEIGMRLINPDAFELIGAGPDWRCTSRYEKD